MSRRRSTYRPPLLDERGDARPEAIALFLVGAVVVAFVVAAVAIAYWPAVTR